VTARCTPKQIGLIHGLAARLGLDDDARRDLMQRLGGARSAKLLTAADARVIEELRQRQPGRVAGLDTPIGRKLRALWIAGFNLGLVRDRSDRAMLKFLQRQTGVSHVRFLATPGDAAKALEGLKSWLARDGGVEWPAQAQPAATVDAIAKLKRAVLEAQWKRLVALGVVTPGERASDPELRAYAAAAANGWDLAQLSDYDTVGAALGRRIRAAMEPRP
jgi:hypothetical protein